MSKQNLIIEATALLKQAEKCQNAPNVGDWEKSRQLCQQVLSLTNEARTMELASLSLAAYKLLANFHENKVQADEKPKSKRRPKSEREVQLSADARIEWYNAELFLSTLAQNTDKAYAQPIMDLLAECQHETARFLVRGGQIELAIAKLRQAVFESSPQNSDQLFSETNIHRLKMLSRLHQMQGQHDDALLRINEAIASAEVIYPKWHPLLGSLYFVKAQAHKKAGNRGKAIKCAEDAYACFSSNQDDKIVLDTVRKGICKLFLAECWLKQRKAGGLQPAYANAQAGIADLKRIALPAGTSPGDVPGLEQTMKKLKKLRKRIAKLRQAISSNSTA